MANEMTPLERWSQQTIAPTTPSECVRALLKSPLGSTSWENPLRLGHFTVQDYWNVRLEPEHRYNPNWPSNPTQLAQLMLDTGLDISQIDHAVYVERSNRDQPITASMQMHRYLRRSQGLSTTHTDALNCLTTAFEASYSLGLGQGEVSAAVRESLRTHERWVTTLHSLMQYDNSPSAQNAYLHAIEHAFAPSKPKPTGALPERGRRRTSENEATYNYGWDSTGSALAQAFPQADNHTLVSFLHAKHDLHGLGALVVQQRLSLSEFLNLAVNPASTPLPEGVSRYGSAPTAVEYRQNNLTETLSALVDMLPPALVQAETQKAMAHDATLADKLQAAVPPPDPNTGVSSWWKWNMRLHAMGLHDFTNPSAQMQSHLAAVNAATPNQVRNNDGLPYMKPEEFNERFGQFAGAHPALANLGLALTLHNIPRHGKATDIWDRMKGMDTTWLSQASFSKYITPELLSPSRYGGEKDVLPFAAMMLPHMNALDKAHIAPIVAYGVGVQSIPSFSPSTLRSMWKEHNPSDFKASIPKQYTGDTYLLFALTRQDAQGLMSTLEAMDVRHDVAAYLQCVETWTRQVMSLPPIIEDIGPTENLFGV